MSEEDTGTEELEALKEDFYTAERSMLIQGEAESANNLDKTMITLSAGALVLSITFINNIAPEPRYVALLFISWGLLMLSLVSIVISMITSQYAFRKAQGNLSEYFKEESTELTYEGTLNRCTAVLTWISIIVFVAGVILLATFAMKNIEEHKTVRRTEVTMAENVKKGRTTPSAPARKAEGGRQVPGTPVTPGQRGRQTPKPAVQKPPPSKK